MKKSRLLAVLSVTAAMGIAASGISVAQDAISKRKEFMKSVGGATKLSNEMIKGDKAFDGKAAADALIKVHAGWGDFVKLFPKGTETGGETTASPKIWENTKDFDEKGQVLAKAAKSAADAAPKGKDAFAEAFKAVGAQCKGCHEVYRIPKK